MTFDSASRAGWIDHAGKRILRLDYTDLSSPDEQIAVLERELDVIETAADRTLVLADFEGASATPEYMARLNEAGKQVRNVKVEKTAVLGITGLKAILLDGYVRFTGDTRVRAFDSEADALDWLAG